MTQSNELKFACCENCGSAEQVLATQTRCEGCGKPYGQQISEEQLLITRVAIIYEGKTYTLPAPNRHAHVIRMIAEENGVGIKGPDIQGFACEDGSFLDRRSAYIRAKQTGQLRRREGGYNGDQLFSEDLW